MSTIVFPVAVMLIPGAHDATIGYAKSIVGAMSKSDYFNPLPIEVSTLATDTEAYDNANVAAHDGGKAATAARRAARKKVIADLHHVCDRVQGVAEIQPSAAEAEAVIASAGLGIKKVVKRSKAPVAASYGATSGSVQLDALRVAEIAMYYWQYSLDQVTWTDIPQTMKTRVLVSGLTPGQVYYFRFHAHTRKGPVDVSQIVSLMIH